MFTNGIDISTWQDASSTPQHVDFNKAASMGAKFVFIKASQSTWLDDDFLINWKNAKGNLLRGAYHYMDWTKPPLDQARFFAGVLNQDRGELPPVLDFECRTNVPTQLVAKTACWSFLTELEKLTKVKPIIYTSYYFWKEFGSTDSYWLQYPLWIANYTTGNIPSIPLPWKTWSFWQYTDKGDGLSYGAESKGLDLNRFNGDYETLLKLTNSIPEPDDKKKLDILWNKHPEYH